MAKFHVNPKQLVTSALIHRGRLPENHLPIIAKCRDLQDDEQAAGNAALGLVALGVVTGAVSLASLGVGPLLIAPIVSTLLGGAGYYNHPIRARRRDDEADFLRQNPQAIGLVAGKLADGHDPDLIDAALKECFTQWRSTGQHGLAALAGDLPQSQTLLDAPAVTETTGVQPQNVHGHTFFEPAAPGHSPIAPSSTTAPFPAIHEPAALAPGHQPITQNIGPMPVTAIAEPVQSRSDSAIDIAASLAAPLKSSIIVGQPGAGKGLTVAYATRAIKQTRPEISIWVIDPKSDPGEAAYWLAADRVLAEPIPAFPSGEDIEDFQGKVDRFVDEFKAVLGPKLLIVDEVLAIKELMPQWFKGFSVACNHLASTGRSRAVYVWLISQSPNASDFGISGGARNVFRRVLLLAADDLGLIANNSTFFSGQPSAALLRQTGRVAFDSLGGKWAAVPRYTDLADSAFSMTLPTQVIDEESRHDRLERTFDLPAADVPHEQFYEPPIAIQVPSFDEWNQYPIHQAILRYVASNGPKTQVQIRERLRKDRGNAKADTTTADGAINYLIQAGHLIRSGDDLRLP
jgi:hypothetical protein